MQIARQAAHRISEIGSHRLRVSGLEFDHTRLVSIEHQQRSCVGEKTNGATMTRAHHRDGTLCQLLRETGCNQRRRTDRHHSSGASNRLGHESGLESSHRVVTCNVNETRLAERHLERLVIISTRLQLGRALDAGVALEQCLDGFDDRLLILAEFEIHLNLPRSPRPIQRRF